jgi:hypothetical protein
MRVQGALLPHYAPHVEMQRMREAVLCHETGTAHTSHVHTRRKHDLQRVIRERVEVGSELHTDALESYNGLDEPMPRELRKARAPKSDG